VLQNRHAATIPAAVPAALIKAGLSDRLDCGVFDEDWCAEL
jgi:hypothetical protein